jgi:hypothetical protein
MNPQILRGMATETTKKIFLLFPILPDLLIGFLGRFSSFIASFKISSWFSERLLRSWFALYIFHFYTIENFQLQRFLPCSNADQSSRWYAVWVWSIATVYSWWKVYENLQLFNFIFNYDHLVTMRWSLRNQWNPWKLKIFKILKPKNQLLGLILIIMQTPKAKTNLTKTMIQYLKR